MLISNSNDTLYLISGYVSGRDMLYNMRSSDSLRLNIEGLTNHFIEVTGRYHNEMEHSFLIRANSDIHSKIHGLAEMHEQVCYLKLIKHSHGLYKALNIDTLTGHITMLGYMRELSEDIIKALDLNYTYNPVTKHYFTIWPSDTTTMKQFEQEIEFAFDHGVEQLKRIA